LTEESDSSGAPSRDAVVPLRHQIPVYSAALFSNSLTDLIPVLLPLWLVSLKASPLEIGIVIGARYVGPLLFSIHGGAMMDRIGTRRVMMFFAAISAAVPLIYPVAPYVPAVLAIQLVSGLADQLGWVGAQTLTGQVLHGNPTYTGRLVVATRVGTWLGPPLAGLALVEFGFVGGFVVMALWSLGTLLSVWAIPASAVPPPTEPSGTILKAAVPRLSDYIEALRLFTLPMIAVLLAISAVRQGGQAMQNAFYAVYLDGIGLSGEFIGYLIAMNGVLGVFAFLTGWLVRRFGEYGMMVLTSVLSILSIAVIPMLTDLTSLFAASGIRGLALAISVVIIVSLIARSVGHTQQGKAMGLRMTCHQAVNVVTPVIMGAIVEWAGLDIAFYLVGGAMLALNLWLGWIGRKAAVPE
jgi:MFS family permease